MNQNDLNHAELSFHLNDSVWTTAETVACPFLTALPDDLVSYFNHPWLPDAFWHECGFIGVS